MENGKNKLLSADDETGTPLGGQIAALQEKLTFEKDSRREERFIFILAFVVLFDVVVFRNMEGWGAPIVIGLLEIFIGLALAEKYGVKTVLAWAARIVDVFGFHKGDQKD